MKQQTIVTSAYLASFEASVCEHLENGWRMIPETYQVVAAPQSSFDKFIFTVMLEK